MRNLAARVRKPPGRARGSGRRAMAMPRARQRFPTGFPFVHCQQVARPSRIFLSQTFPAESALPRPDRQRPGSRCPEIPFAGIRRCQGRASRRACMLRPHPRPDRHARLQPSGRPDVGARGLLARDPVASAVRPAGAGRRGSGPGAEPALALRRGEGAVGHADARAARRGRPPRPPPLRSGGVHAALQRGKALEGRTASGGRLPVAADGTGRRSSRKAVCRRRCARTRRDGSKTSCRQALGAATVRPDHAEAFPLAPEPVRNEDGRRRNDCERNALRRLAGDLRRERPHTGGRPAPGTGRRPAARTSCFVSGEGLPLVPGAKPGDHGPPSGWFDASGTKETWERRDGKTGIVHRFERDRGRPADDANFGLKTDMPGCGETGTKGRVRRFSRAADLPPVRDTACPSCGAAACGTGDRERDVPDTETREGCSFGHGSGHGGNRPWGVFMTLAMPAFLIDRCGGTAARRSDGRGNIRNASPASGTGCGNRPDFRLPGLEDPLPRARGGAASHALTLAEAGPSAARSRGSLARRTMPARPCRAVTAPATLERPRTLALRRQRHDPGPPPGRRSCAHGTAVRHDRAFAHRRSGCRELLRARRLRLQPLLQAARKRRVTTGAPDESRIRYRPAGPAVRRHSDVREGALRA